MDPITHLDIINRTALVVKVKQPFIDWLKYLDPEAPVSGDGIFNETDVYLLPDLNEIAEMKAWLEVHFDQIFTSQLDHWHDEESLWVENRTFKMFTEWFDYSLHTMIWDTQDEPIETLH